MKKNPWLSWSDSQTVDSIKSTDPDLFRIIQAIKESAEELFSELGPGYDEPVYQQALAVELDAKDIPFRQEAAYNVYYKGNYLGRRYIDFVIDERLAVEVKVGATNLTDDQKTQGESAHNLSGYRTAMLYFSRSNRAPEIEILDVNSPKPNK